MYFVFVFRAIKVQNTFQMRDSGADMLSDGCISMNEVQLRAYLLSLSLSAPYLAVIS